MSLADPQSITVNAVAKSMPRILQSGTSATYRMVDQTFELNVKHTELKRDKKSRIKSLVSFTQRAIVPDPLTAVNDYETVTWSLQLDRPVAGFTQTQVDQMLTGFKTWADSTLVGKLFGLES